MDNNMKKSIILDNYNYPRNNVIPEDDGYIKINSNSKTCIDNIDIYVKLENNIIKDIKYYGEACVIAISSSSILSDLLIGKTIEEAKEILDNYMNMISENEYNKEILKDANVYDDICKQPNRIPCATIFVKGINKIVK